MADLVQLKIETYIAKTYPTNIFCIINDDIIQSLLNGYSYAQMAGVSIVFPRTRPATVDSLDRRDSLGGNAPIAFYPLCQYCRQISGQNVTCFESYYSISMKYLNNEWTRPKLYRCPLQMWEMAYPLHIAANTVGVLFSGPVIVENAQVNWRKVLAEVEQQVDWDSLPNVGNQIADIFGAIDTRLCLPDNQSQTLKSFFLRDPMNARKAIMSDTLVSQYQRFLQFGLIMQDLLIRLQCFQKDAAIQSLIQTFLEKLGQVNISSRKKWWSCQEEIWKALGLIVGIRRVELYTRKGSRFQRWVPLPTADDQHHIPARVIVPFVPLNHLTTLSMADQRLTETYSCLGLGMNDVTIYRSETDLGDNKLETLIVLYGKIPDAHHNLCDSLCRLLSMRTALNSMIFELREAQEAYQLEVVQAAHSFRTPLQSILFDLSDICRMSQIREDETIHNRLVEAVGRIMDAKEDLHVLLEGPIQQREPCNIIELIDRVLRDLKPQADAHPCALVKMGTWPSVVPVRVNVYQVHRALRCLVDNAIKYSYQGKNEGTKYIVHEVRIWIEREGADIVAIRVSNYGIGIPPAYLENIHEPGRRANVPDSRGNRMGTGLGLVYAIRVFEQHGGWLYVTSNPSDSGLPNAGEPFHRYITEVRACLPLFRERSV